MIVTCNKEYDSCIETSSKLNLINSMIDHLDECGGLSEDDYNHCIGARNLLYRVSKNMEKKAKSYIGED